MRISVFKAALVVLICAPIMFALPAHAASPTLTLAEQEVIESLLSQDSSTKTSKKHVIAETTSIRKLQPDTGALQLADAFDEFANHLRGQAKNRDKAFREALDDFLKKNRDSVKIAFPTNAPTNVELVSDVTVNRIFSTNNNAKPNGWDLFYRRFPDSHGLITISRVGIDSNGTVAIIYLGEQSNYLAGGGRIRIFNREGGKWILKTDQWFGPEWRL